jgi:hypothetical protein
MTTLKELVQGHCLDFSLIQMMEVIEEDGCTWGLTGGGDDYEGVVFSPDSKALNGKREWRFRHRQPNAAFHEAICRYSKDKEAERAAKAEARKKVKEGKRGSSQEAESP